MRRLLLLTRFLLLAAPALSLGAQPAPRSAVGVRVRLMTPTLLQHPQLIGRLSAVDSESVTIHTDFGDDTRLPRSFITEVAISRGATPGAVSTVRAAAAGLLLGALAGRLSTPTHPANAQQSPLQHALRGGVIGGLAGAVFGAVNHPERWEPVVLRGGTLDPLPTSTHVEPRPAAP